MWLSDSEELQVKTDGCIGVDSFTKKNTESLEEEVYKILDDIGLGCSIELNSEI